MRLLSLLCLSPAVTPSVLFVTSAKQCSTVFCTICSKAAENYPHQEGWKGKLHYYCLFYANDYDLKITVEYVLLINPKRSLQDFCGRNKRSKVVLERLIHIQRVRRVTLQLYDLRMLSLIPNFNKSQQPEAMYSDQLQPFSQFFPEITSQQSTTVVWLFISSL